MNKIIDAAIDVLFIMALALAIASVVYRFAAGFEPSVHCLVAACFCLLMGVLLCVYPKGGRA
jgi:hypothetical protein